MFLLASFALGSAMTSPSTPVVNHIIQDVPDDLNIQTLLLPRFDEYTAENAPKGMPQAVLEVNNREAKRCNQSMLEIAEKRYPFKVELVSLSEVEAYREKGYRYFMDMVLMPKQMEEVKREVLTPSFQKYPTTNRMFTNDYVQVHYYFYIRDLETHDVYVTSRLKGNLEAFDGITAFLKQVSKDMLE